jgi:hypothetical protein
LEMMSLLVMSVLPGSSRVPRCLTSSQVNPIGDQNSHYRVLPSDEPGSVPSPSGRSRRDGRIARIEGSKETA